MILSDKKRDKRGTARDKTRTARDKTGTARDKTGTTRDKTGTAQDKIRTRAKLDKHQKFGGLQLLDCAINTFI